jgi:hypothetical protein
MAKLDRDAAGNRCLFAPLVFRLALKLEQVPWSDFASSASEAMYVLRAAQRLFKLDAVCTSFDTWLEAEAAGLTVERDDLGYCCARPQPALPRAIDDVLASQPLALAIEILRRTQMEAGEAGLALAALSTGATMVDHLFGEVAGSRILSALTAGTLAKEDADRLDYVRQLNLAIARAYLEAGAAALLLLQEVDSPDVVELDQFVSVFNLAAYYGTPLVLLGRHPISAVGQATLARLGITLYLTPQQAGPGIVPLANAAEPKPVRGDGDWLALSRWEIDPDVAPETIQSWRRVVIGQ